jgi:hypothetical protein
VPGLIQRLPLLTALLPALLASGCAGGPLFVDRGDFPPPDDPSAPPLPTDYPWGEARKVDLDNDGRKDLGYYTADGGGLVGAGFDENHDGRVDVFKKYGPDGKVVEETRDTDHDGVLDQRSTDTDGDGKFDKVLPYPSQGSK